jgi:hypothetical protein
MHRVARPIGRPNRSDADPWPVTMTCRRMKCRSARMISPLRSVVCCSCSVFGSRCARRSGSPSPETHAIWSPCAMTAATSASAVMAVNGLPLMIRRSTSEPGRSQPLRCPSRRPRAPHSPRVGRLPRLDTNDPRPVHEHHCAVAEEPLTIEAPPGPDRQHHKSVHPTNTTVNASPPPRRSAAPECRSVLRLALVSCAFGARVLERSPSALRGHGAWP